VAEPNPLLATEGTPRFDQIRAEHALPAVQQRIEEFEALLEELMARGGPYTWEELVEPLDLADERISRAFGPLSHLNSVLGTDALREAHQAALPLLTEHAAKVAQDQRLCAAIKQVREAADEAGLDEVQRRVLDLALRDFRLAGVDLPPEQKQRYREIQVELSQLSTDFSNHLVDEAKDFRLVLEDPADVEGLPGTALEQARAKALEDDPAAPEHRWTFTLHAPSVQPFLQYQPKRELRRRLHRAYATRASEGERDNAPLIDRILALRAEMVGLLGFETYADYSLATKMAASAGEVLEFLGDLAERSLPYGRREVAELTEFARARDGVEELESYDLAYYRELLRQERYSFSDDEVRQFFPLPVVLDGLFETLQRLYGLELTDVTGAPELPTWHESVRVLAVKGPGGEDRGHLMLDLFARDGKRSGAWMNVCVERRRFGDGRVQDPVAYLVCNFTPPAGDAPTLLRHTEVVTLFHECGHCLHHVLTQVDRRQVAGIAEVPWDGVELPSQFHENWVWQAESLRLLARHHQTGAELPPELLEKMLAAKNFMGGADMLRQLEFALFDLELHAGFTPGGERGVRDVLAAVRRRVAVVQPPEYDRFENGFGHIFAGGYAAGYYSYKWAEVLAADAFSRFEEEGIFSQAAGAAFREQILERGGAADLMELYVAFRGRKPTPDALLRHSGLAGTPA